MEERESDRERQIEGVSERKDELRRGVSERGGQLEKAGFTIWTPVHIHSVCLVEAFCRYCLIAKMRIAENTNSGSSSLQNINKHHSGYL